MNQEEQLKKLKTISNPKETKKILNTNIDKRLLENFKIIGDTVNEIAQKNNQDLQSLTSILVQLRKEILDTNKLCTDLLIRVKKLESINKNAK